MFYTVIQYFANNQGTGAEPTVVQMSNQGCFPKTRCNRFRGSFFVTFLEKQKSKRTRINRGNFQQKNRYYFNQ
jgi:hypothetical protein